MSGITQAKRLSRRNGTRRPVSKEPSKKLTRLQQLVSLRQFALRRKSFTVPSRKLLIGLLIALSIAMFAYLLQGCASPTPPSSERAPIPASLTSPCPDLSPLENGEAGTLLRWIVEVSGLYRDCSNKHGALVEAVR